MTSAWDALIGQDNVVAELAHAVADPAAMTHAWLITGPPGSGRSTAAVAFAAALQCPDQGCGVCSICSAALAGSHPDVDLVVSETLSYGVDDARDLILRAAVVPADAPWHIVVIEDADRLTESAVNVLLKVLEEPPLHLVWLLCAPSPEDVLPTIRSRTRGVHLRTPSTAEVAQALSARHGVDAAMAAFAARSSQGHIGRARALATDAEARRRRQEVLRLPASLRDLSSCFAAAEELLAMATEDASSLTNGLDMTEEESLMRAYGAGAEGVTKTRMDKIAKAALKDLRKVQASRRKRAVRDQLDRALVDLLTYFRDVLVLQMGAEVALVNDEMRTQLLQEASMSSPSETGRRLDAIERCRLAVQANGSLPLVLESMLVEVKDPLVRVR
ncbi:MAG: DNA polymerase III subunit delta' [Candidatus Nanopelagicales bacterium]|nr:DNA polymerase III subunit delta' [Candidatus Nanopelagicales bacterium]MDP4906270.1 DNA polymerase III subunit delta' [Candidatus Nanopelagicales bacterium]MDP4974155.1 DNA polymerase III subunit delta' [Candidatus Nanopelagicales bacterium]